ncbi:MAG: hypothetical protein U0X93_18160, partial [Anaerolineales bacterium]
HRQIVYHFPVEVGDKRFLRILFYLFVSPSLLADTRKYFSFARTAIPDSISVTASLGSCRPCMLFPSTALRFFARVVWAAKPKA